MLKDKIIGSFLVQPLHITWSSSQHDSWVKKKNLSREREREAAISSEVTYKHFCHTLTAEVITQASLSSYWKIRLQLWIGKYQSSGTVWERDYSYTIMENSQWLGSDELRWSEFWERLEVNSTTWWIMIIEVVIKAQGWPFSVELHWK